MFRFAVVLAALAVASAAPGFIGTGLYGHGAVFPGHVGYAAAPAIVKTAVPVAPVAPVAYAAPAVVKSAVVAPVAPVAVAAPAIVKTPVIGAYGYGPGFGGHLGGFGGHYGGFGGHFIH